jgi:hypothetical protein
VRQQFIVPRRRLRQQFVVSRLGDAFPAVQALIDGSQLRRYRSEQSVVLGGRPHSDRLLLLDLAAAVLTRGLDMDYHHALD